jgi:hypothetical protein
MFNSNATPAQTRQPTIVAPQAANARPEQPGTRYWVVGGRYTDTSFTRMVGHARFAGPFMAYNEARNAWQVMMQDAGGDAGIRFTIAEERERA